jgi:hypothetical protein
VIDIRRFDRVDLLFKLHGLRRCLFKVLLMHLFPSKGILSSYDFETLALGSIKVSLFAVLNKA